ncbi:hypothetical protein ACRN9Z_08010 [Shewanella frigidimarina]|jgi:hypothetical protein|uniref:Uncharacterized protein n=1 Tax=Shewanella frigidimarina (strain NCIMB 400) TaxID=318167 RepID=Q087Y5_SHEFN|nr:MULTISPECIES: hypothetical protein [Shewanella]ABI70430.1 conserved hypothetical protein [Shewanella frigidimarina NCIMB 400]MBB1425903.1 hypothetical protein [Shewanella sp. SG44-2]PKI08021.1 hypothetical protein CXF78_02590 [Shewanella sp. 11B5]HBF48075.1 hypothetical protein [Shewanella frigidimarina]|tara:strand:+ start:6475 stop:6759 length:285 start_codon:yes stop_codon:yes gene_type:complete
MERKPDRVSAMKQLLDQVKTSLPLDQPGIFSCGPTNNCVGCPKKLLDLVDAEMNYWDAAIAQGVIPSFGDISRFGKLCRNVSRGLQRNDIQGHH